MGDRLDVSNQPQFPTSDLLDILRNGKIKRELADFSSYDFNGVPVPRVTTVLDYCSGNPEFLLRWAAGLGDSYNYEKRATLKIGTAVHNLIEEYLMKGTTFSLQRTNIDTNLKNYVFIAFNNFLHWYMKATKELGWTISVYIVEMPIVCPWCAGTFDALIDINGKRYLIDFKTSKKLDAKYIVQVSAYLWIVNNFYPDLGTIDGVGLIRLDKFNAKCYEDLFFELSNPADAAYIYQCQQVFGLALQMFYSMHSLNRSFSKIKADNSVNGVGKPTEKTVDNVKEEKKEIKRRRKYVR